MLVENGYSFLVVDHACQYWAFDVAPRPAWAFASPRLGTLDEGQLTQFNANVMEQPWAEISGERSLVTSVDHPGAAVVWRDDGSAVCFVPCEHASSTLESIVAWARSFALELVVGGADTATASTLRYVAATSDPLEGFPTTEWEGPTPLAEIAVTPEEYRALGYDMYGGHPILEGEDASELIRIRELYRSGSLGDFAYQFLPLTDEGLLYTLWARDTLPFEDAEGLVRGPGLE